MVKASRYPAEVRERAVRLVFENRATYGSEWAAIESIAGKIGCHGETLRAWIRQSERDAGKRTGLTTSERERLKELERENRELKRDDGRRPNELVERYREEPSPARRHKCLRSPVNEPWFEGQVGWRASGLEGKTDAAPTSRRG